MKQYVLFVFLTVAIAGCTPPRTETPPAVLPKQASFDGNRQDSGVIDTIATGVLVSPSWKAEYDQLVGYHGSDPYFVNPIKAGDGLTRTAAGNYVVDDEHFIDAGVMRAWDRVPNNKQHPRATTLLQRVGL